MRRLVVTCALLLAVAAPLSAAAARRAPVGGTLVVRGADNGEGTLPGARPVATLVIDGFVIGRISGLGRIEIYDLGADTAEAPEVSGALWHRDKTLKVRDLQLNGTAWGGTGLRFRAVNGAFRVVIWGSGVYLFASGRGMVTLTGQAEAPLADGQYSLNGGDFHSIPVELTRQIAAQPVG